MADIQCTNCKKIVRVPDNWPREAICNTCGGSFVEVGKSNQQNMQRYNISNQFQGIGNQLQSSIPHISIGRGGLSTKSTRNTPNSPLQPPQLPISQNPRQSIIDPDVFTPNQEKLLNKVKNWGMIIIIALVIGYAAWRIFFG